jgi:hypothetical protein
MKTNIIDYIQHNHSFGTEAADCLGKTVYFEKCPDDPQAD